MVHALRCAAGRPGRPRRDWRSHRRRRTGAAASRFPRLPTMTPAATSRAATRHERPSGRPASSPQAEDHPMLLRALQHAVLWKRCAGRNGTHIFHNMTSASCAGVQVVPGHRGIPPLRPEAGGHWAGQLDPAVSGRRTRESANSAVPGMAPSEVTFFRSSQPSGPGGLAGAPSSTSNEPARPRITLNVQLNRQESQGRNVILT